MDTRFATITPTRGDRPLFDAFCKYQLSKMNVMPTRSYFIDYEPKDDKVDLIPRLKHGIELAKADGIDLVFVIENDDSYGSDYFDNIPFEADFIGEQITTYYNLRNNTYQEFEHRNRSSLFTTGFRISALDGFKWPADDYRNVDVALWAANQKKRIAWRKTGAIGIKHNCGMTGGSFHTKRMKNVDKDWEWLQEHVSPEAYGFYKTLKL